VDSFFSRLSSSPESDVCPCSLSDDEYDLSQRFFYEHSLSQVFSDYSLSFFCAPGDSTIVFLVQEPFVGADGLARPRSNSKGKPPEPRSVRLLNFGDFFKIMIPLSPSSLGVLRLPHLHADKGLSRFFRPPSCSFPPPERRDSFQGLASPSAAGGSRKRPVS